jgi:hypothetical protein
VITNTNIICKERSPKRKLNRDAYNGMISETPRYGDISVIIIDKTHSADTATALDND